MSYTGSGKYANSSFKWFDDLPDSEEVASEEELQVLPPDGQGWWPVIALNLDPACRYYELEDIIVSRHQLTRTKGRVLIICFYQLLEGRLVGWWVYANLH